MKRKPSGTTVIALLALFFSLGGAGVAAFRQGAAVQTYKVVRSDRVFYNGAPPVIAHCRPGDTVLSGGFAAAGVIVTNSDPVPGGWEAQGVRDPNYPGDSNARGTGGPPPSIAPNLSVLVICAASPTARR